MPNWTENRLTIEASKELMPKIREKLIAKGDAGEEEFTYSALIPMPELLRKTASGSRRFEGSDEIHAAWYRHDGESRPFTTEERAELEKLGARSWYDWSCNNWGVKWDASDVDITCDAEDYIEIEFNSPWGPPHVWLEKLREVFPGANVGLDYRLEDDSRYPHSL